MNSKLPLNLDDLLRRRTVEGERIEYMETFIDIRRTTK
jgi:hypothetical protein